MSLAFLEMDENDGACPHCGKFDGGLIYTSFSTNPVSCELCLWAKKAEGVNVERLERLQRERHEAEIRVQKELKELALELGRKRLERMKQA